MQLFILNRTNERQTKSVGRILLYALLYVGVCVAFVLFTYRVGMAWRAARRQPVE